MQSSPGWGLPSKCLIPLPCPAKSAIIPTVSSTCTPLMLPGGGDGRPVRPVPLLHDWVFLVNSRKLPKPTPDRSLNYSRRPTPALLPQ